MANNYHLVSGDNLYIRIVGLDEKMGNLFNVNMGNGGMSGGAENGSTYLSSYTISEDGTIDFPVVGPVIVKGLTIEEAKDLLHSRVSEYLKEPTIIIKLTSFNITLLGEWRSPGKYPVFQDKITIFELR